MGRSEETRLAIIRAAEKLFARDGVDAVSFGEIVDEAGQKNRSAVQYHFGDKRMLLDAILARHSNPIQLKWVAQLELMEKQGTYTVRDLIDVLVRPIVEHARAPDGGREYISISAQLVSNPQIPLFNTSPRNGPGALKMTEMMMAAAHPPAPLLILRMQRMMAVLYHSINDYATLTGGTFGGPIHFELFMEDLIDALLALVELPPSARTQAELDKTEL